MTGGGDPRVVLTGGTGFTGGLVARRLQELGLPFVLTGRSPEKVTRRAAELGDPPSEVVDVSRPETLSRFLNSGDVVANCAGPFARLGEPVVRAAVEAGAHYLDTTGEQRFMKRVVDALHRSARERGVAVVNAMAFEYALGDAACSLATRRLLDRFDGEPDGHEDARRVAQSGVALDVTYLWGGPSQGTSPGTRASVLGVLSSRGLAYEEGEWREEAVGARRRTVRLPDGRSRPAVSFPSGEVVTAGRQPEVRRVRGWLVTGRLVAGALGLLGPVLPPLARAARPVLEPIFRRAGPEEPSADARDASRFTLVAEARPAETMAGAGGKADDDGAPVARVRVEGRDPYGVTAGLVALAAGCLLEGEPAEEAPTGVLRPSALLEPQRILSVDPRLRCAAEGEGKGL